MSKYIKVDDLQRYCDNQKDHTITPNDFQRMNFIELPDKYGRLIDADELEKTVEKMAICDSFEHTIAHEMTKSLLKKAPTVLEAST